jgi:hypothetical protein
VILMRRPRQRSPWQPPQPRQRRRGPGRPFQPGESGNPAGKRPRKRHRATTLVERLLGGKAVADGHSRQGQTATAAELPCWFRISAAVVLAAPTAFPSSRFLSCRRRTHTQFQYAARRSASILCRRLSAMIRLTTSGVHQLWFARLRTKAPAAELHTSSWPLPRGF